MQKSQWETCPHCNRSYEVSTEDDLVDFYEHRTYCNPAHRRAEFGEEA